MTLKADSAVRHGDELSCPNSDMTIVDTFELNGTQWVACEVHSPRVCL